MDLARGVSGIFELLDADRVEAATMACFRLARLAQDHLNAAIFLRELSSTNEEVARTLYGDTSHLGEAAGSFLWKTSFDRWVEVHTMDYPMSSEGGENLNILKVATGEIEPELDHWKATLVELTPPPGMTPFDTGAFHDSANAQRALIRLRIRAFNTIKTRLKTRCLNYAIQMERQIASQNSNQAFLWEVQNGVNNYFKQHNRDVYYRLQKASALAGSAEAEDAALVLTEVRRTLQAAADHFYPPRPGPVLCSDGKERVLGPDRYLNRLYEHLADRMPGQTTHELARAELALLDTFTTPIERSRIEGSSCCRNPGGGTPRACRSLHVSCDGEPAFGHAAMRDPLAKRLRQNQ